MEYGYNPLKLSGLRSRAAQSYNGPKGPFLKKYPVACYKLESTDHLML